MEQKRARILSHKPTSELVESQDGLLTLSWYCSTCGRMLWEQSRPISSTRQLEMAFAELLSASNKSGVPGTSE